MPRRCSTSTTACWPGINDLTLIRQAALKTQYPPLAIIQTYDERLIAPFDTFSNDIAAGTGNASMQTNVTVLNALLRMEDDASLQRAYLYQALASPSPGLTSVALTALNQAATQQQADTSQFTGDASVTEAQNLNNTVSGPQVDAAKSEESLAVALTNKNQSIAAIGTAQTCGRTPQAQCWYQTQGVQISDMRQVSNGLVGQVTAQANSLTSSSLRSAIITSVVTLLLLILVLLITTFVARSMIRPLRKLRADALEVAGSKLPDMVRRLSESEGGDESVEIEPIGVTSTDEIGEVARAFDQVHMEAVRLAADEAMLRGNLNAMFVNLSRRSQSLIERQLALIDDLEQSEQDADRLSSLFRLDHLATRMRRNSENLLVLAGHEASRRWSQPVPLVDVLRAAISEIEQYERVVLNVQPGIQVVGQAVNDVVHLVAEIVENATTFSPEDTQVYVTGQPLTSGGVLLDITDNGVGISEQEMAHANWRLDNPPVVDVAVSRRMGLFVVGRLAARHGVRVRLRHAQSGGLTALIWLPESVAAPESGQPLGRLRKFEADDFGPAPSLSAPPALSTMSPPGAPGAPGGPFGLPGGPQGPGGGSGGPGGPGQGGLGSAAAAAAAAARIPRFSGGARNAPGGGEDASGFNAFGGAGDGPGAGANGGTREFSPFTGKPDAGPARRRGPRQRRRARHDRRAWRPAAYPAARRRQGAAARRTGLRNPGCPQRPGRRYYVDARPWRRRRVSGHHGTRRERRERERPRRLRRQPGHDSGVYRAGTRPATADLRLARVGLVPAQRQVAELDGGFGRQQSWSSPADEGWRAARVAASPAAGENTTAGLPKRVPRANLVPGSVSGGEGTEVAPPARSAELIRTRMASFQRGVREARAAAPQNEEP